MPRLGPDQCYQIVRSGLDVSAAVASLAVAPFFGINYHLPRDRDPNRPACDVLLAERFTPEIRDLIESLDLGGTIGRVIARRLQPGYGIPPHTDAWMPSEADWRRFQVPLVTRPDVLMRWPCDGVEVHLEPGRVYEVRYDRPHEVVNPGATRVHLQIDQIGATV